MRILLVILGIVLLAAVVAGGGAYWRYSKLFEKPSSEVVLLDAEKRHRLQLLRHEKKFGPHDFPPLGYTGVATPEEGIVAMSAVDDVLDSILKREDGPLAASTVSDLVGSGMTRVKLLETEDRERVSDYMIEIWYVLGFKGSTGRFAYGSYFQKPLGYGEPLPPGWKSPSEPRPIRP